LTLWGEIAAKGGHTVVYADCELSNKQFEKRYTDGYGVAHIFPDSLFRVSVNHRALIAAKKDYIKRGVKMETDEIFIKNIEEIMTAKNADVLIVDNISLFMQGDREARCSRHAHDGIIFTKILVWMDYDYFSAHSKAIFSASYFYG
jgi:hypothetical protein